MKRAWPDLALAGLLAAVWACVYVPRLTLLPEWTADDFYLMAQGRQWGQTGQLTDQAVDSPFPESGPLRQDRPTPVVLDIGHPVVLGLLSRVSLLRLGPARLVAGLALLGLVMGMACIARPVLGRRACFVAGVATFLDPNLWYAGRVVRSDALTACLGTLGLYLAWRGGRDASGWRLGCGALLVGVAQCFHPTAMLYGVVFAALVWGPLLRREQWRMLLLATLLCGAPVAMRLGHAASHWAFLQERIAIGEASVAGSAAAAQGWSLWDRLAGELGRYGVGWATPYSERMLRVHQVAYAVGALGWVAFAIARARRAWGQGQRWPRDLPGCAAAHWVGATLLLALLSSPAHKWGTYLVHVVPPLYLMAAYVAVEFVPRGLARATGWVHADRPANIAAAAMVALFAWGGAVYGQWYASFDRAWSYGNSTASLAPHVPPGALLAGPTQVQSVAWASGAAFLHNRYLLFAEPALPRFPWRREWGPWDRLRAYTTDPDALAAVAALAPGGLYVAMDDPLLMRNAYAPYGHDFGGAVRDWQDALRRYYVPVAEHYGAVHGRTALHRYVGAGPRAESVEPVRYWEGRRLAVGAAVPGWGSVAELADRAERSPEDDGHLVVGGGPSTRNIWSLSLTDAPRDRALLATIEVSVAGDPYGRFVWLYRGRRFERGHGPWYGHPQRLRHSLLIPPASDGPPPALAFQSPHGPAVGHLWTVDVRRVELVTAGP